MIDRITQAHNLRRNIHAYLIANPHSMIDEVFDAFPDCNHETLRKSIYRMRRDGDVQMIGTRGKPGRFSALTESIKPESETRAKLRSNFGDRYDEAYKARMAVLEYYKSADSATSKQMAIVLGTDIDHATRTMSAMARDGVLEKHGSRRNIKYTATGVPSLTADGMRDRTKHKQAVSAVVYIAENSPRKSSPGRYVHVPGRPISNQGGIGSGSRRVHIGSTAGML